MSIFPRTLFASVVALLLGSCSLVDIAYNNAPYLVGSEFEDAFDLSETQLAQLDSRLEQFFAWHREEELAQYRQFLDRAALATADGITETEFLELHNDVMAARDRLLEKAIDSLGDLAVSLTPQQIESFKGYFMESSEELRDYLEKSEQQRETYRLDRNLDRLEDWFGNFDSSLEQKITARLIEVPDIYPSWFEFREKRHQALVKALRDSAGKGIDPQRLKKIMIDPDTDYARAFEPVRQAYWQGYAAALADISSWLSDKQRQRAVTRLQKYASIIDQLSSQPPPKTQRAAQQGDR
jgi:hypothetical protein